MIMTTFKSRVLNAVLAVTAAIPLAAAGTFTFANPAEAAALKGDFQLIGGLTVSPFSFSLVELSKTSLTFTPQPITPIGLAHTTGSFTSFNSGNIGNIIQFSSLSADNPFIDFGQLSIPGVIQPGENTASLVDKINTFTLQSASYSITQSGSNVSIDVALDGFFSSAFGEISKGSGNLTFQANNTTVASVNSILNSGDSIKNMAFSGALFATVPEPATVLGLGIVGAAIAMSRRRKVKNL
jgi:hypothetical protein